MDKSKFYQRVTQQAIALVESESDLIANLANISSLLNMELEQINWVGFYLLKESELVLGPFHGNPACTRIPVGAGVCGTAVQNETTIRVDDVHQFEGHIACDSQSNSEIVVPFYVGGKVVGVLDIDSPKNQRFDAEDQIGLENLIKELQKQF
ncbi:GAF domain-containing protein [Aliivibrio kagoshimensis]|uniref:GAF domain-containing protein n=1 Tax=Aliivibrio kagoshimensis TaxID=2910230 RepID=UPI003D0EE8C5